MSTHDIQHLNSTANSNVFLLIASSLGLAHLVAVSWVTELGSLIIIPTQHILLLGLVSSLLKEGFAICLLFLF